MTPSEAGALAEAAVRAAPSLRPGDGGRNGFHRVQCKTGRLRAGAVRFRTHSTIGRRLLGYDGEIDYFGVFCPDNGAVYLVPAAALPERGACLRVSPAANGQREGIRWAEDFLVRQVSGEAAVANG